MPVPPFPAFDLATVASRERTLDALAEWFVAAVLAAGSDREVCLEVMRAAVVGFYDVREAADLPRGMYAGHFFLVDGVGIEASERPVPWFTLAATLGRAQVEALLPIFDEAERSAR